MSIVSPSPMNQIRRFRFSGHKNVVLSVYIKGSSKPVKVAVKILDDTGKAITKMSPMMECEVAPSEVCSGLFDKINASKGKKGVVNDDGVLTDLLTKVSNAAKNGEPDPPRVSKKDSEVDWEAVRNRICRCLPGRAGSIRSKLAKIEEAEKELAAQKKFYQDELKEQEASDPKDSKETSGSSTHSSQQTNTSSTPQKNTKHGEKK